MKNEILDRFYTKPAMAKKCVKKLLYVLPSLGYEKIEFIEPSSGSGAFIKAAKEKCPVSLLSKTISCDIDSSSNADYILDYLKDDLPLTVEKANSVVVGNPPFGKRSDKAISFVNRSLSYADTIAFIVPLQFKKWSVQKHLKKELKLIFDEDLPENSFEYEGTDIEVRTCFQIWTLRETSFENKRLLKRPPIKHSDFEMFLHNNTRETLKYFDKEKYRWHFAVPRQGYYNYNLRITEESELRENIQWMFFKADEKKIRERIRKLDFEKLSFRNTTIPGFGKADVVCEYSRLYGK